MSKDNLQINLLYEELLNSYAKSRKFSLQGFGMKYIKYAFTELIVMSAEEMHSAWIIVALAGVAGELAIFRIATSINDFLLEDELDYNAQMNEVKDTALEQSALWLVPYASCFLNEELHDVFTNTGAKKLLLSLLEEYFPCLEVVANPVAPYTRESWNLNIEN